MTHPIRTASTVATKAIVVVAVLIGATSVARAQSAEAEQLFSDGNKRMAEGKLAEACEAFEASNRIESRAGTLIRLGECREARKELASAWSAYKDALTRVKDKRKREVANKRIAAIEPRLSYLTITVAERAPGLEVTRNDKALDGALLQRALPVDGGDYTVVAKAPGKKSYRTTAHVPNEGGKIVVDIPALAAESGPPAVASPSSRTEPAKDSPIVATHDTKLSVHAETTPTFTLRRNLALTAGGLAVTSAVAGILLGRSARDREHQAFALCPDASVSCDSADAANHQLSFGRKRALEANIAFGAAGALAVGAAVLWFTGASKTEHDGTGTGTGTGVAIAPSVSSTNLGIVVTGSL